MTQNLLVHLKKIKNKQEEDWMRKAGWNASLRPAAPPGKGGTQGRVGIAVKRHQAISKPKGLASRMQQLEHRTVLCAWSGGFAGGVLLGSLYQEKLRRDDQEKLRNSSLHPGRVVSLQEAVYPWRRFPGKPRGGGKHGNARQDPSHDRETKYANMFQWHGRNRDRLLHRPNLHG